MAERSLFVLTDLLEVKLNFQRVCVCLYVYNKIRSCARMFLTNHHDSKQAPVRCDIATAVFLESGAGQTKPRPWRPPSVWNYVFTISGLSIIIKKQQKKK